MKHVHWISLGLIVLLSGVIVYQNIFDPVSESPRSVKPDFPRAGKSLLPVNKTSNLVDPNQSADVSEDVKRHIAFMEGLDPLDPQDKDWLKGVIRDRLTHAGIPVSEIFVEAKVMEYINAAPGSRPSVKTSSLISPSVRSSFGPVK